MIFNKFGAVIPIRLKANQYNSFYGVIIGFNAGNGAVLVRERDAGSEYWVKFMRDERGTWWQTI